MQSTAIACKKAGSLLAPHFCKCWITRFFQPTSPTRPLLPLSTVPCFPCPLVLSQVLEDTGLLTKDCAHIAVNKKGCETGGRRGSSPHCGPLCYALMTASWIFLSIPDDRMSVAASVAGGVALRRAAGGGCGADGGSRLPRRRQVRAISSPQ